MAGTIHIHDKLVQILFMCKYSKVDIHAYIPDHYIACA